MTLVRASSIDYLRIASLSFVAALLVSACTSTEPKLPKSLEVNGTLPTGTAGLVLATAPTFTVKDASGAVMGGVAITVTVTSGGGTLTGAPATTLSGSPTPVGTWTLGRSVGPNTLTVTVGNLQPLTITVVGVAGPPASIAIVDGNNQSARAGSDLSQAVRAQVRDQFGNGVSGAVVNFAVTNGGGTIAPQIFSTDGNGIAGGAFWKLGKIADAQTVVATAGGFTAVANATVATDYSVDLRFFGPTPAPEAAAAFTEAAGRIRAAVVGDVPDVNIPLLTGNVGFALSQCGVTGGVVLNEVVDDVVIYATVTPIDGPGKILASAGPCIVRLASGGQCVPSAPQCNSFSIIGVMRFDADDIAGLTSTNRLNGVVLHEMMHVVGVGTNWNGRSLLSGRATVDPRFVGQLGIQGCNEGGGGVICVTGIPVENIGGSGTADAHWRETVFDSELMTGFSEAPGVPVPMSVMTIQSLADEGYIVNLLAADPYTIPISAGLRGIRGSISESDAAPMDIVARPLLGVTPGGSIVPLIPQ
jgi:hypothetical protein